MSFLSFHSSFLSSKAFWVSAMYFSSSVICWPRSLISFSASDLDKDRAEPSSSIASRAFSACSFWPPLAAINLSCVSLACFSAPSTSSNLFVNVSSMRFKVSTILPDLASYFSLKTALRFSFFQSFSGTSPSRTLCRNNASPLDKIRCPISTASTSDLASAARAAKPPSEALAMRLPNRSREPAPSPEVADSRMSMAFCSAALPFSISSLAAR
mmetsp:Transcript_83087/g.240022  ORF Transcript_83087/g.240022 Transcript_83087/m.240022 type:complete len:213 (+) Transcript_83087:1246-1884(+)